jgi:ribosomal protein L24
VALKGTRVFIIRGVNKGAFGIVIHADHDSFMLVTDDNQEVYDRIENIARTRKK